MIRTGLAAAAVAVALVLSACSTGGGATEEENAEPYRVLVLGGVSAPGALGANASVSVLAAQASAAAINEDGGIAGREIEITVVDDQADPTVAVTKVQEAINSDTPPDAILNSGPSTIPDATLPIINAAGILSFNIGPTATSSDPTQFPLNFDLSPGIADYLKGFVEYLSDQDYQTIGVIHGSSPSGELWGKLLPEVLGGEGYDIVENQGYDSAALDMAPQLEAIQAADPDVLFIDGYGAPVGYILQGIDKLGWDVPIIANNSVSASPIMGQLPPDGVVGTDGVKDFHMEVFQSTKHDDSADGINAAVEHMLALGPINATMILAYNYDGLLLIKAAAEKVGNADDPAALAEALEDSAVTDSAGTVILTKYAFSADSHSPNAGGSEFVFIEPSELKDGQFQ